jgi:cytochrome d ubiquinol oxidase subunit II
VLGAFVQGFSVQGRGFAGGPLDWLTPFSLATGIGLVLGYGLLGATWCVMKTTGELELWARKMALRFLVGVIVAMAVVSLWVPFLGREIEARWFSQPNIFYLAPVPIATAGVAYWLYRALEANRPSLPFFLAIGLFLLGFLGLGISLFPYIVPPNITIWQAANTVESQRFALYGFALVMPLTFIYTGYAYWVFRGKVAEDVTGGGYH